MNADEIGTLYTYNQWSNRQIVAAAGLLSPEDFTRDLQTSHGSVKGTLVHVLGSEWFWLLLLQGEPFEQVMAHEQEWDPEKFASDASALAERWSAIDHDQQAFVKSLTDERLLTRMSFDFYQGQRWKFSVAQYMQHVVNHSSYHRGQVATLLRQLGQVPSGTDFLFFVDETA